MCLPSDISVNELLPPWGAVSCPPQPLPRRLSFSFGKQPANWAACFFYQSGMQRYAPLFSCASFPAFLFYRKTRKRLVAGYLPGLACLLFFQSGCKDKTAFSNRQTFFALFSNSPWKGGFSAEAGANIGAVIRPCKAPPQFSRKPAKAAAAHNLAAQ